MKPCSIIIPSRDNEKVINCVASLIEKNEAVDLDQIVIVSDGLSLRTRWTLRGVTWVKGRKPFVFPRAINMGVEASDPKSDILILGDDVRFETPNGVRRLQEYGQDYAAVAPEVVGVCGQSAQRAGSGRDTADWLAFICALIPRQVWDRVGRLDERFVGYGYDDVDWCIRASKHGLMRVAHDVRVHHLSESSYRSQPEWLALYQQNRERFEAKWQHKLARYS